MMNSVKEAVDTIFREVQDRYSAGAIPDQKMFDDLIPAMYDLEMELREAKLLSE